MMDSIIVRIIGLGFLFIIIISTAYFLYSSTSTATNPVQATKTISTQQVSETFVESGEILDAPVVKLASLSVITDYPAANVSDLTIKSGMTIKERTISAKQLASDQKFDAALRMLETSATSDQEAYSLDYLKAQILSWAGDYNKAEKAFTELRRQYPQDVDIAVSFGYLHLYQNNFDEAEQLFLQVLNRFPDYQDAQIGLKRATAIQ